MEETDPRYVTGFNNGYLLAKHEPEVAKQLATTENAQNAYFNGLINGKEEYDREVREWAKGISRDSPARDEREHDRER